MAIHSVPLMPRRFSVGPSGKAHATLIHRPEGLGQTGRMLPLDKRPSMPYKETVSAAIAYTSVYQKQVAKILRAEDRKEMELYVADHPEIHPVVAGTGGVRKARWRHQGKGKRGGARVIYFYRSTTEVVYFLDIYAKSEKEDLTPADKQQLKELTDRLRGVE
jgi:hypothetical protein